MLKSCCKDKGKFWSNDIFVCLFGVQHNASATGETEPQGDVPCPFEDAFPSVGNDI